MATSKILAATGYVGYTTGQITTAEWAAGSGEVKFTAPGDGLYIIWIRYALDSSTNTKDDRSAYKELEIKSDDNPTFYTDYRPYRSEGNSDGNFGMRTVSGLVRMTKNQSVYAYVNTNRAGMKFNCWLTALKIA